MAQNRWMTSDLKLGAYLRLIGFKIAEAKKVGSNVVFEFEDREDRKQIVTKFYARESNVEPLAFMASISEMRDMITMAQREIGGIGAKS